MNVLKISGFSLILIILACFVVMGCSNSGNPVTNEQAESQIPNQESSDVIGETQILTLGTMNLDDGTVEFNKRNSSAYLNVTNLLGSNFWYTIDSVLPGSIFDITLTINNPTIYTVHDVCIVFENLYGKTIVNPTSYMDIYGSFDLDPFIGFRSEDPNRAFPPIQDSEELLLKYTGGSPFVDFFIIAHLGGNTGGVYEITDWEQIGTMSPWDECVITARVRIKDHQNDVLSVVADASVFTGGITTFLQTGDPEIWEAEIRNINAAPIGTYVIPVMATSSPAPPYQTYNFFEIEVGVWDTCFVEPEIEISGDDALELCDTTSAGQHSMASRGDNFYLVFYEHSGAPEGAIYLTKSTDGGTTWSHAQAITSDSDGVRDKIPSIALGDENIYVTYTNYDEESNTSVWLTASEDEGDSWTEYNVAAPYKAPQASSVCVDASGTNDIVYVAFKEKSLYDVSGDDRIRVGKATADNLASWVSWTASDLTGENTDKYQPSVSYNQEFNKVIVAWSGRTPPTNIMTIYLASIDCDDWHGFLPAVTISSNHGPDDYEYRPSVFSKFSGEVGVGYYHTGPFGIKIEFVLCDIEDGQSFQPTVTIFETSIVTRPSPSSLFCDMQGRWIMAWVAGLDTQPVYTLFFSETFDEASWSTPFVVNNNSDYQAEYPTICTNGTEICVAWKQKFDALSLPGIIVKQGFH